MKPSFRIGAALAMAACIAGCASPRTSVPPAAVVTPLRTKVIPADRAEAIGAGRSTRADVIAALGETLAISFESGFEVWVYRIASERPAKPVAAQAPEKEGESRTGEFVVLFAPSGIVAKTRFRPPGNGDARLLRSQPDSAKP
jgi:hypothetical protein